MRGDANEDGKLNLADAVGVLVGSIYSSGLSVIVLQEPAEPFATTNASTDITV